MSTAHEPLSPADGPRPLRAGRARWYLVRWAPAVLLAAVAVWLSIRQVAWSDLQRALVRIDAGLLGLALASVLATTAAKAARWHVLLTQCNAQVHYCQVMRGILIGQLGNALLPARLGDAARAILFAPQSNGGVTAVVGTIIAEKALDAVIGVLLLSGLALWIPLPSWVRTPMLGLAGIAGGLSALLVLAAWWPHSWSATGRGPDWLPGRFSELLARLTSGLWAGLGLFRQGRRAAWASCLTVSVWALGASTNVLILAALDLPTPPWAAWLVLVAVYAAGFLPSVPAHVGLFEYACLLALSTVGVAQTEALAFALILHAAVYAPPAILGSLSMAAEGLSWARLKAAQTSEAGASRQ